MNSLTLPTKMLSKQLALHIHELKKWNFIVPVINMNLIRKFSNEQIKADSTSRNTKSKEKVKTAILMLNMGGPSSLDQVQDFLTRLFTDEDIISLPMQRQLGSWIAKRRTPSVTQKYSEIGGGSPILKWTKIQGQLLTELLDKISPETAPHKYYVGFRYAHPLTEDTLNEMERDGVQRAVAFSQYPQYSCSTSGSSINAIFKFYKNRLEPTNIKWSFVDRWSTHPGLINSFAELIQAELKKFPPDIQKKFLILFSAHSLPLKAVARGDSYPAEVAATVSHVMENLNWSHPYRLVWQSKVGPIPWLSPYTDEAMKGFSRNGYKNILLVPIAFVNEHIETLHEMDIEYGKDLVKEIGIKHFARVPTPNDHPLFIQGLAEIIMKHLSSKKLCSPQLKMRCPLCTKAVCCASKNWLTSLENQQL